MAAERPEETSPLSSPTTSAEEELKSPQSSASDTAAGEGEGESSAGAGGDQPEKRKRGRPRKPKSEQPEEPKVKRPRGRPKGSKNKLPSKASLLKNYSPQKTKRGRSRGGDDEPDGGGPSTATGSEGTTSQQP